METFYGILIPFLGTSLGAACVFFMKKSLSDRVQRSLTGFAAGVMVAASSRFCRQRSDFGQAFCSCFCLTTPSPTCTAAANRRKARKADCTAPQ